MTESVVDRLVKLSRRGNNRFKKVVDLKAEVQAILDDQPDPVLSVGEECLQAERFMLDTLFDEIGKMRADHDAKCQPPCRHPKSIRYLIFCHGTFEIVGEGLRHSDVRERALALQVVESIKLAIKAEREVLDG